MTEAGWLRSRDIDAMLAAIKGKAGPRKLRLFGCACCRHVWDLLTDRRSRRGVEVAEQFADGRATDRDRSAALAAARATLFGCVPYTLGRGCTTSDAWYASANAGSLWLADPQRRGAAAARTHCQFLRDVVGNPFRPVAFDPSWRTSTAVGLARTLYESRDFAAMPILADALEEAGCDNPDILTHCRGPGPHVRGCWVVDLVLDKS